MKDREKTEISDCDMQMELKIQNHAGHEGGEKSSIVLYRGLAVKRHCGIRFMKYPPLTMNATLKCLEVEAGCCLEGRQIRG